MNLIALKMLTGDRARYLGIVFGLTFASFLITQQAAIFVGLMARTFGQITDLGLPDIWVANYERESFALYRNEGKCLFRHVSRAVGVTAVGALFVGFGTVFFDADRDGDEDLFVANGHVIRYPENAPLRQEPVLFENLAGKRFENAAPSAGPYLAAQHRGRGVAQSDFDDDEAQAMTRRTYRDGHWAMPQNA